MGDTTETQQFYAAVCKKLEITRPWEALSFQEQVHFTQACMLIWQIVHGG